MFLRKTILMIACLILATPSWSRVFFRWTQSPVPPASRLGVSELVVPFGANALITDARKAGYIVYAEVPISQVTSAARASMAADLRGIVLNPSDANQKQINIAVTNLRTAFPRLTIRVLDPRGQQPE